MNRDDMQRANRCQVLRLLLEHEGLSRVELARRASLQKGTITNIINEFDAMGLLASYGGDTPGTRGERLCIRSSGIYLLSISINRKNYRIRLYAIHGEVVRSVERSFDLHVEIGQLVREMLRDIEDVAAIAGPDRILCATLAMPGPYIRKEHAITYVSGFEQLGQVDLERELDRALPFPVMSQHDAKLSAYAEWSHAAETRSNPDASLLYIGSVGSGIGAGLITHGGKILMGQTGIAGEIGHMGINFNGPKNEFGHRGTFEYYASTESALQYVKDFLVDCPDTVLSEDSTYAELMDAYHAGDALAQRVMQRLARMMGYGIANLVYALNPDCIVLGADYPDDSDFMNTIISTVREMVQPEIMDSMIIRYSTLQDDTVLLGGYYYALMQMDDDRTLYERISRIAHSKSDMKA